MLTSKMINTYEKYVKGKEDVIRAACRDGATVDELCKILGCKKTAFHAIKKQHSEFYELLKESRCIADYKVENALFKRACGFEYEEVTTEVVVNKDGVGNTTFIRKNKRYCPPDTGAAMAWLRNRIPNDWNAQPIKQEVSGSFSDKVVFQMPEFKLDEE